MSDYDVFPLHHFLRDGRKLPYDGQLTVYSRFVPALVSGSASEYLRIARRIGESIHKHVHMQKYINENSSRNHYQKRVPWSDMKALQELKNASKGMFVMRFDVVSAEQFLKLDNFTEQHCEWTDGMRAVHFSRKSQGSRLTVALSTVCCMVGPCKIILAGRCPLKKGNLWSSSSRHILQPSEVCDTVSMRTVVGMQPSRGSCRRCSIQWSRAVCQTRSFWVKTDIPKAKT